jgi:hypothetical protein
MRIGNRHIWRFGRRRLCGVSTAPRLSPEAVGDGEGVDAHVVPPSSFVAGVVKFAMMGAAERYGEFVADLASERFRLCEADVMRVGG